MAPPQLHRVRFTVGEVMAAVALFAVAWAWPLAILPIVGVMVGRVSRKAGRTRGEAFSMALGSMVVIAPFVFFVCWRSVYYAEFRSVQRKLASQPGVTIVHSWKHEDITLEDCGFSLRVRDCPPVGVDFLDGKDWHGQFRQIDGVMVWQGYGSATKLIRVERLAELGMPVRDLPELLAHLEGVLAAADGMEPGVSRPWPEGRWVVLRYPLGGGWH